MNENFLSFGILKLVRTYLLRFVCTSLGWMLLELSFQHHLKWSFWKRF